MKYRRVGFYPTKLGSESFSPFHKGGRGDFLSPFRKGGRGDFSFEKKLVWQQSPPAPLCERGEFTSWHTVITRKLNLLLLLCAILFFAAPPGYGEKSLPNSEKPKLIHAVTCEGIKERLPWNETVIFSIAVGKAFCFTHFDPVPQKTFIYHNWFHADKLNATIKLTLTPPNWATFSNIQLRESDKGPWRVEITDTEGNIFRILRFSITD